MDELRMKGFGVVKWGGKRDLNFCMHIVILIGS